MARKKVKLAYIVNDSARKATFRKRKKGLMKKVSELSTLCGIDACTIIYSPYEPQPEVWPNPDGVQRVIDQFKRMPEMEQTKKMVNQESFIRQRIAKAGEQLKKIHMENREKHITEVIFQSLIGKSVEEMPIADLNDVGWLLDQNLKGIQKKMESLQKLPPPPTLLDGLLQPQPLLQPPPVVAPMVALPPNTRGASSSSMQGGMDGPHMTQLFTDWMNNPNDQNMGFGNGEDMLMQLPDNHNSMGKNGFFP
ncbi:OLC1v1016711C1 [Oldenlandia corymbosa var. corymbosa]|uniref:OLC1v1016711C1 n=1 Tax=Oldenlandia corymbosa var. corymbosa TaxID=529605 RepID=A0AAV1E7R3_OLDCO|nr:OLC1v1016711C1 [Oldenlandia corymbosa var. corymbosa]